MVKSDVWLGQESISSNIKCVRNKFNFKFSNLFHMFKRHICIRNYMNMIFIALDYGHLNFFFFPVFIIHLVSPDNPLCRRASVGRNHSCMILGWPCHSCLLFVVYLEYIKNYIVTQTLWYAIRYLLKDWVIMSNSDCFLVQMRFYISKVFCGI